MEQVYYESVIGRLLLTAEPEGMCRLDYISDTACEDIDCYVQQNYLPEGPLPGKTVTQGKLPVLTECCRQLDEYFAGTRKKFTVPLIFRGTEFQTQVWNALREIPYGETRSYGQIAAQIGNPGAARAVGMGCNRNPLLLLIPCHRVIGSGGALTGFGCGLSVKAQLLMMEELISREDAIRMDGTVGIEHEM